MDTFEKQWEMMTNSRKELQSLKQDIQILLTNAATLERQITSGQLGLDPRRNLNDECGYPETSEISPQAYKNLYDRESIAARVVEVMPKESWQVQPMVFEDEEYGDLTPFEETFSSLGKSIREESWYQDDECNPIWEYLLRADILSGVGWFGILLLGIDDGADLNEPVTPREKSKLIYLRAFDESLVQINTYEKDRRNRRYGQPLFYNVTLNDPNNDMHGGTGIDTATVNVHWTRVIHIADNLGSSEIFGPPRMMPVYNRLLELNKLYGGSAEMYYKGAFPGYLFSSDPALKGDVNWNITTIRNQIEQMFNGLQRYAAMKGMVTQSLAPQVVDPSPQIDKQLEAICIRVGIPKRKFIGSERGELSSGQDEEDWNDKLKAREKNYITPRIIIPFVDRLIWAGVLPEPKGYSVYWPDLGAQTELDKANVAEKKARAMAKYIEGNVEALMTPMDFLVRILKFSQSEATAIVDAATEAAEERMEEEERLLDETGQQQILPPGQDGNGKPKEVVPVSNIYKELSGRLKRSGYKSIDKKERVEQQTVNTIVAEPEEPKPDKTRILKIDNAIINESEIQEK